MVRRGFGLIEVLVSITLLGIALLGVAGSTLFALRMLRDAEAIEQGALDALQVIDSLVQEDDPADGQRLTSRHTIRWQILRDSTALRWIDVSVAAGDAIGSEAVRYRLAYLALLP
jgi:prepilin-type N-terminal cleavage/methylation domain-containing protein